MKCEREIDAAIRALLEIAVADDTHPHDRQFAAAGVFALNWALDLCEWPSAEFEAFVAGGPAPEGRR